MKKLLSLALILILMLSLFSAAASAEGKKMVIGDTTFNAENWEETIDPHRTYNGWPCIRYGVGETLVHYTDTMELEPWLATEWTNDGNNTWTITLRDGVKFSSGRDMDAEAVKQCFEHLLENHDRAPGDTKIESMEADGQVLTIVTSEPNPALMNYLAGQFCAETGFDGDFDEYAQQDLRIKAERAKQQLTSREKVPVMVDVSGMRARIEVTRETFEEITASMLASSIERTDAAIALAKEKGYTVDEILLVGGSTKMPQVPKALVARYGKEPRVLEPDEAVAKGAALFALGEYEEMAKKWQDAAAKGELDNADQKTKEEAAKFEEAAAVSTEMVAGLSGKKMKDVVTVATTKSYALKVLIQGREVCQNMIIKNTPMRDGLASVSKRFGTVEDDQRDAELVVFETDCCEETFEVNEEFVLGTANLELPSGLAAGSPIEVTFTLNKEGILEVTGRDLVGNREVHATMQASSGATMSDADVEAAKQRSKNITIE